MYSIFCDGECIHDDMTLGDTRKIISPTLTLSDNSAGSLEFTIPPCNVGYDNIKRLSSEIIVKRYNVEIWSGRVITEKSDFWNNKILTCEGELAYLNDTIQPQKTYTNVNVRTFISEILTVHNSRVAENRKFEVGAIYINDISDFTTNYENTLTCITDKLISKYGGHIQIRKENGKRYIDYLEEYINTNNQVIEFGKNLLDFTKNWDMSTITTAILPRGSKKKSSGSDMDTYVTVESVNAGSPYITSEEAIKEYGWIEGIVDWEDITDSSELKTKAEEYISDKQFDEMIIEVSIVDLPANTEPIKLLDQIRCVSTPHGLDKIFPVTELTIPLLEPENVRYTLGTTVKTTLTSSNNNRNKEIDKKLDDLPKESDILAEARNNAYEIMNQATNGYISIIQHTYSTGAYSEALVITDSVLPANDYYSLSRFADKYWMWNINGLSYYSKSSNKDEDGIAQPKLAITMDGAIVADFITVGTMSADRIRTGLLMDEKGNTTFDLNEGILTMKKGSINLGEGVFQVDDNGFMKVSKGDIGGFTIDSTCIYNDVIRLDDFGLNFYNNSKNKYIGSIGKNNWALDANEEILEFNLQQGRIMAWTSNGFFKMFFTKDHLVDEYGEEYKGETINFGCDVDFHRFIMYNAWFDPDSGGINGGPTFRDIMDFMGY